MQDPVGKRQRFMADEERVALYDLGQPGDAHRVLEPLIGDWDVELTVYTDPDAPLISEGMRSRKGWIMGGRHVHEELYSGTIGSMQNRRVTLLGHNNVNGRYELTTVDDLDTHNQRYEGQADPGGDAITLYGTYTQAVFSEQAAGDGISRATGGEDPPSRRTLAGVLYEVRSVLTIEGINEHLHRFHFRPAAGGDEVLAFQFAYARR